ncbi:MAG: ATP-binding protein, partial [Dehalococcoidales bacterium]
AIGVARVALPLTTVDAAVDKGTQAIIITLLVITFLIVLLTAFTTRHITSPLSQIARATEAVSSGDLSQQVTIHTHDEVGRLGQAFNDMAARLSQTTALANAEKSRLEVVLTNLADGIIMMGADGRVLLANPVAENLFNFRLEESKGRSIIEVAHDHEVDALYKKFLASGEETMAEVEHAGHYIHVVVSPLPADQPGGALILLQDLTQLRTFQMMRQEFVANVSHELRTPLAGIKAIVEILQDGALEDRKVAGDFLNRVDIEVDKLTQMVSELMELSRIETGRVNLELKPTDLNLLLQESVMRFSPQAERQKLGMVTQLDDALPQVQADSARLMQVINNILHNAIKFTPAGGRIAVSSHREKDRVVVTIADTGIGISEADLPHIFERFYKVDRSRASQGTGLGLAIAKHIVLAHGGQIWAESEPGKGAVFSFSLPLQ